MPTEITRNLDPKIVRDLWARAAGRCQFNNCNRPLYKSPVTQEQGNISEVAHIYSFSKMGARGWGPLKSKKPELNRLANLMLLCHDCHKTIDRDQDGKRYSATLLKQWKEEHERRIAIVTGVNPTKKSHVILYGANIGEEKSLLQPDQAKETLFPKRYPAEEQPICVSMTWEGKDDKDAYWQTEATNLRNAFDRKVRPLIEEGNPHHLSVFALAPMPLMVLLGTLITDKVPTDVYQLHREPNADWVWLENPRNFDFIIKKPSRTKNAPVLILSLSDSIDPVRVTEILGKQISVWELTVGQPNNDFLKSQYQLSQYRESVRKLMVEIGRAHGKSTPLSVFPAMPVACAVEFGRVRMPKADMPWVFYDQNNKQKRFIRALEIGGPI